VKPETPGEHESPPAPLLTNELRTDSQRPHAHFDTQNATIAVPELDGTGDALAAALAYAAAGIYMLPVRRGTKDPGSVVGKGWQHKSSSDPKQIAAWFVGTDHGVALHAGRSGLVVIDVDHPERLPDVLSPHLGGAPFQSTRIDNPGQGHYVFRQPPGRTIGNSTGRLGGDWGDVRGLNGVIIVAPSQHANAAEGGRYAWLRVGPVPELPAELAELLDDGTPAVDAATDATVAEFRANNCRGGRRELLQGKLNQFRHKTSKGASRHESMVPILVGAMTESGAGYYPSELAIGELRSAFLAAKPEGAAEFDGMTAWAIAQALAADLGAVRDRVNEQMTRDDLDGVLLLVMPARRAALAAALPMAVAAGAPTEPKPAVVIRRTPAEQAQVLAETRGVFTRWLGAEYDLDALYFTLAVLAVLPLGGDPLWGLLVSGSGNAKTETVQAIRQVPGAHVVSTVSSPGALLSATAKRETTAAATGGLLRVIGDEGSVAIKDVTSILSMGREMRGEVLAALREVYDGSWVRTVGTDGGRTLEWKGRIALVGAVTTAWDAAHAVVASMGDRFVLLRMDSTTGRAAAGRRAIGNTGDEVAMREQLAEAVAAVIVGIDAAVAIRLVDADVDRLLAAADLVTLARTAVEFDYRGDVADAHAPEMPTRFAKQLGQVVRGGVAIGLGHDAAMRLAVRCARDSMPPLRLAIIDYLRTREMQSTAEVRKGIDKPRATVDRQLQALHMLGVLRCDEQDVSENRSIWRYSLADGIDPTSIEYQKCQ